jgi:predicted O-methyltransferase YrrM
MRDHVTPRYIINRSTEWVYRKMNPGLPWLTPDANKFLGTWLKPDMHGLELGSGRSTLWFAKRVKSLISVESDKGWYDRVKKQLNDQSMANVDYIYAPLTVNEEFSTSPYLAPVLKASEATFDFILVDGDWRDHAAFAGISKLKPGGILIVDNVNWFLPSASISPSSIKANQQCSSVVWTDFNKEVMTWKKLWTSDGVTDTAVFFRP